MTALGLVALLLGSGLLVGEAHLPTGGALGGVGVAALAAACWLLIGAAGGGLAVALTAAIVVLVAGAAAMAWVGVKVHATTRRALPSGTARLRGTLAEVRAWDARRGQVAADGTLWRAKLSWGEDQPPRPGDHVVIESVDNLTLLVRTAEPWELS